MCKLGVGVGEKEGKRARKRERELSNPRADVLIGFGTR